MYEFNTKLTENGRIVIPAKCRKMLGWSPGEDLVILIVNGEAKLLSLQQAVERARSVIKSYTANKKVDLVKMLLDERKKDAKNDKYNS